MKILCENVFIIKDKFYRGNDLIYELLNGTLLHYNKTNGYYYTIETENGFLGDRYRPFEQNGRIGGFLFDGKVGV